MGVVAAQGSSSPGPIRRIAAWKALCHSSFACSPRRAPCLIIGFVFLSLLWAAPHLHGLGHKKKIASEDYGLGFSTEITSPENEVEKAVEAIVNNGIIQGSKEFNKDQYIEKATAALSSPLFPPWKEPGKVYYKVRTGVLAPLHFKDSNDEGTLAVRYVVQSKDASKSILRIDAVFVEDFRHTVHPSDGSVESAESQEIQNQIDEAETEKKQNEQREKQRLEKLAGQELERKRVQEETSALAAAQTSVLTLDQHLESLRHLAERVVKAPGGQLKSAPFRSATNVKSLDAGAEVVILIVTPYWYGVETTDGQHGWIHHAQLEPLP